MKNLRIKTKKFIPQRRARRFNRINNKITYNYRGNVQTYGPGFAAVNIDYDIRRDIVGEQLLDYTIQQLLVGSDQFYKYREQYNLFKITNFYVIMFPDDNANNENTYLNVDWFNSINIDNIQSCEWSKIMYNDRKGRVTFRFKPLNMNIEQNRTPDTAVVNPRQYIYTANIASYPGHIKIYHNGDTKIRCKIIFRILFRRPEPPVQPEEIEPNIISRVERELNNEDDLKNIDDNKGVKNVEKKKVKHQYNKRINDNNNDNNNDNSFREVVKSLNKYNNMLHKLKNKLSKDSDNNELQKLCDKFMNNFVIILRKVNNIKKRFKIKDQKTIDKWRNFTVKKQFDKLKNKENKEKEKENNDDKVKDEAKEDIKTDDNKEEDNHGLNQSSILRLVNQAKTDYEDYKDMRILDKDLNRIRNRIDKEEEELGQSVSSLFDDSII